MHVKREISTSVSDLHVASVSDSIKRLAISKDGHPMKGFAMHNTDQVNGLYRNNQPIMTVMSSAKDDFLSKYEILGEIGKGGFSIVHKCMQRNTKHVYAVKVKINHIYIYIDEDVLLILYIVSYCNSSSDSGLIYWLLIN